MSSRAETAPGRRRGVGAYPHGRVPAAARSEQLLDVAERLFARRGYAATSIEAIAREAGVTRPIVYKRFGSKERIYVECLRRARGQMESMLSAAAGHSRDLRTQVELAADAYFRFVERDSQRWRVLFGGEATLPVEFAQEAIEMHLATERRFAELFAVAAAPHEEQRLLAYSHAIGGAAHQLAQWWLRTPGISREQVVGWYCALVWDGLGAAGQPHDQQGPIG
jgi:AcrR family transcriptional regulator